MRTPKRAFSFPPHHFWYGIVLLIAGFIVLWTELPYHDVIAWMLAGAGGGLVAHDIHEHTHTEEAHEDPRHPKY